VGHRDISFAVLPGCGGMNPLFFHRMKDRVLLLVFSGLLITACGGGKKEDTGTEAPSLVIGADANDPPPNSIYQMPTPNELFEVVRVMDGEGRKSAMSPASNADRYVTLNARALNFGVYATDMVYASNFRIISEITRYYLACKKLGDELGLNNAFSADIVTRLDRNVTHGDSLDIISNDAYYRAYEKMQDEKMGPVLALSLAGGWIESMHLVMDKIETYDGKSPLIERVTDQKLGLEHLIEMMDKYISDPGVAQMKSKLLGLRDIYDQLNVQRMKHEGTSPSGRMVLGDDVTVTMTEEKYKDLRSAVERIREEIIRGENETAAKPNS
jgi:hypothetical protein